jgi:hypothetical protein
MKKISTAFFAAGVGLLVVLGGCAPPKQVISGYADPAKRIPAGEVRKPGDGDEENEKMEALIRKLEKAEQRLREMEQRNQETLRRLEEASKKTERSLKRIEKAGEKIEAVGRKEVP